MINLAHKLANHIDNELLNIGFAEITMKRIENKSKVYHKWDKNKRLWVQVDLECSNDKDNIISFYQNDGCGISDKINNDIDNNININNNVNANNKIYELDNKEYLLFWLRQKLMERFEV